MTPHIYGFDQFWQQSDAIIKTVALLLLTMSLLSWTLIASHLLRLLRLRRMTASMRRFWRQGAFEQGLDQLAASGRANPFWLLAQTGREALAHHQRTAAGVDLADWLDEALAGAVEESAEPLQRGLSFLASVGASAPFIGLFGTVWGIYHALIGLSSAGTGSLDKVAGPVGEALIMTAFGLAVAIPAVLAYNGLTRAYRHIRTRMRSFARQLHGYFVTGAVMRLNTQQEGGEPR